MVNERTIKYLRLTSKSDSRDCDVVAEDYGVTVDPIVGRSTNGEDPWTE